MEWQPLANLIGVILVVITVLSQVAIWQRKEYRWDRLWSELSHVGAWPHNYWWLAVSYSALGLSWLAIINNVAGAVNAGSWLSLLALVVYHGLRFHRQGLWRPVWTAKAALVVILSVAICLAAAGFSFLTMIDRALQWSTLVFFTPIIVLLAVSLVNIPAAWQKGKIIEQAVKLRRSLPHLKAVGVTGSYGKTSTKFFLEKILIDSDYKFAVSHDHRNSEVAIAQDMNVQLKPSLQLYIAEMGAYKMGEIAALARLVQPSIGVITAIGNQHLGLFGSTENILRAKWELLSTSPAPAVAILNADDTALVKQAPKFLGQVIWYSLNKPADVWMEQLKLQDRQSDFILHIHARTYSISVPLISRGLIASLAAAVATAVALNVTDEHICQRLSSLKPFPGTMAPVTGKNNSLVIDDSYSASVASIDNVLEYIEHSPLKDKRLAIVPMIELGTQSAAMHYALGEKLIKSGAKVFIYGSAWQKEIKKGANNSRAIQWFIDPRQLISEIAKGISSTSLIVLEGRLPDVVLKAVLK